MSEENKKKIYLESLIYPLFVKQGLSFDEPVESMPGVFRYSLAGLKDKLTQLNNLGIKNLLLFGIPQEKTWQGETAWQANNFLNWAISFIKAYYPGFKIFSDVCLCAYTQHGHCGIIPQGQSQLDREATLSALTEIAVSQAKAGADFVCPSAMARHQVKAIRQGLDRAGFREVKIMSYSVKFASNFYGPFRQIADSSPRFGDRKAYQLDYQCKEVALARIEQEIQEGAEIIMVKPGLAYLDIVYQAKEKFKAPLAVYNVSGEYALVKLGAKQGFWSEQELVYELIASFKRVGADYIITYYAADIAAWQIKYEQQESAIIQ